MLLASGQLESMLMTPRTYAVFPLDAAGPRIFNDMSAAMLVLDEYLAVSLDEATASFAAGSPFERSTLPFHINVVVADQELDAARFHAVLQAVAKSTAPLSGRCVRWEIAGDQTLRLLVDFDIPSKSLCDKLRARLPRGFQEVRPAVVVGSVAQIDTSLHAAFLAAVQQACPISETSTFTASALAGPISHPVVPLLGKPAGHPSTKGSKVMLTKKPGSRGTLTKGPPAAKPKAVVRLPSMMDVEMGISKRRGRKKNRPPPHASSRHLTWVRPGTEKKW